MDYVYTERPNGTPRLRGHITKLSVKLDSTFYQQAERH